MLLKKVIILSTTILFLGLSAQKISYDIPELFKNEISDKKYKTIANLSVREVSKREKVVSLDDGIIKTESGFQAGLDNLLSKSKNENDDKVLAAIVKEHFDGLFDSIDFSKSLDLKNYNKVEEYLSLRIYPEEYFEEYFKPENAVFRKDLEGTVTMLMLDLPTAFTNVQRKEMFDFWKKDEKELFAIAQQNINKQTVTKLTQEIDLGGSKIEISFIENETYAGSYGLDLLNNSKDFVGELGSVVAFPNKGIINICKITKEKPVDFVRFIQGTKGLIRKFHDEHPYPISSDFFWYYDGKFTKIMVIENPNGNIDVVSPHELTQLLVKLK
ncbi:hypothetical protein [Chryseobacterium caseinilyticum]|uniref:Uncharacterized protein n=1 Tax=Chryseobacterium caseinilyticum TaxID=2771428 RepID=A0ABR8ZBK9_9FLAO|nr:hypothetical protein [Chryseobacterium caseinilyticum]MBD8082611.1 hypothetical protein [Chryseobacterium caseinilyticum]